MLLISPSFVFEGVEWAAQSRCPEEETGDCESVEKASSEN